MIEFVRRLENIDYRNVAEYLSTLVNSAPPKPAASRRLSSPKVFRPYSLSLPLNNTSDFLRKKTINPSTAEHFEAGEYKGKGFLSKCVGIRLHDLQGYPIGYAGRRLDPHQVTQYGKWKFPSGLPKSQLLYNFHRIRSQINRGLFIVEGPWGVMRLSQLNIPAIALLGLHISDFQFDLLYKIPRLILMLDGDEAGRKATVKLLKRFETVTNVDYVILPPGCDPDDLHDDILSAVTKPFFF